MIKAAVKLHTSEKNEAIYYLSFFKINLGTTLGARIENALSKTKWEAVAVQPIALLKRKNMYACGYPTVLAKNYRP